MAPSDRWDNQCMRALTCCEHRCFQGSQHRYCILLVPEISPGCCERVERDETEERGERDETEERGEREEREERESRERKEREETEERERRERE